MGKGTTYTICLPSGGKKHRIKINGIFREISKRHLSKGENKEINRRNWGDLWVRGDS